MAVLGHPYSLNICGLYHSHSQASRNNLSGCNELRDTDDYVERVKNLFMISSFGFIGE